jgi:hypothetical protein
MPLEGGEEQMEILRTFYEEKGEGKNGKPEASWAEIFLFLATLVSVIYAVYILSIGPSLSTKFLILLFPALLWGCMRASRKDMNAAAALAAGLFGGGAIGAIATRLIGMP